MGEVVRDLVAQFAEAAVPEPKLKVVPKSASIQGEQQQVKESRFVGRLTDEAAIADYVGNVPDEYALCRERGRHDFPAVDPLAMRFDRDDEGHDVWTQDCQQCGMAYQEEVWLIRTDAEGYVRVMRRLSRKTKYHPADEAKGEQSYLAPPGTGFVAPSDFRETRVASRFLGRKLRARR